MSIKLAVCVALFCASVGTNGQVEVHPCHGRDVGFAPDLNNCRRFWRCSESLPTVGLCDSDQLFHNGRQMCVYPENADCFRCTANTPYRLSSVAGACHQFTRCFFGRGTFHACHSRLWFDGRPAIRNCNIRPSSGHCHLSNDNEREDDRHSITCPNVDYTRPLFIHAANSCER